MTHYRLIHRTELGPAPLGALPAALGRPHRLPSFARDYAFHHGAPPLDRALRPLQGKFSIVNPAVVAPLPPLAHERLRELVATLARGDARLAGPTPAGVPAPAAPPPGAAPGGLALFEPAHPRIAHETRGAAPSTMPGRDIFFWAELRYRVVLAADAERAADPAAAAAADVAPGAPLQWFHAALLIPDADALRQMTPATAHFYRGVTGRLGAGSTDRYWYLDAWERFHEGGQVVGCVSPSLVEHGHVGGAAAAREERRGPRQPTAEDVLFGDLDAFAPTRFEPYTPRFDRRGFVPPGYCLVHYFATIEIAHAPSTTRSAAA
jgi:hypothetical protein